ncbi:Pyruvate carboxylase [Handroanthus impetiginosus]|uniref:Pyruvate carboxylase n=1 Tax=Handroanthus impetiginosus TaxID=429701 RepID=A0A2G9HN97_9LAMI|nr:Pyruvate carboxylase [Handroanthus impetiginosus]
MESAAVLRSFHYAVSTSSPLNTLLKKPGMLAMNNAAFSNLSKYPCCGGKIISRTNRHGSLIISCVKTSDTTVTSESNSDRNGAVPSDSQDGSLEKKSSSRATFPEGFEDLITEVCNETEIAELKLKFGAFELHMKRNVDGPTVPAPVVPEATTPSVPSKPANESTSPPPSTSSAEKLSPFTNASAEKAEKLAALEASGSSSYITVSSSMVGSFRRARTLKGKKQPIACKEGDLIKEGHVIGFVDQFGTEHPVRSDVAGEVLKFLYEDGEAVGYGDPIIAVLPSFHDIS